MRKKIAIVTGGRAEFGLLRNLVKELDLIDKFDCKLLVTGSHLSKKHGYTIKEIINEGFEVYKKVYLDLRFDNSLYISKSISKGVDSFAEIFEELKPNLLILLGDRYEILSAAIPAVFAKIPIAHIGGGEITEGAFDDVIRHSLTKYSHIHFVSTDIYRRRVIQLGEDPKNVHNVGGMGIDSINSLDLYSKKIIEEKLNIKFQKRIFLITYHPATLYLEDDPKIIKKLLSDLKKFNNVTLIFTLPNSDKGSFYIYEEIQKFVKNNMNAFSFKSLGQILYFSILKYVDVVIGNSSSGILEVPYFRKPTINLGDRQKGRLKTDSVIDCDARSLEIEKAINLSLSEEFNKKISAMKLIYGNAGAAKKISNILEKTDFKGLINKSFYTN